MNSVIMHYGVPQTPDGKGSGRYRKDWSYKQLTPRQRARRASMTKDAVDSIISTLDKEDRHRLGMDENEPYLSLDEGEYLVFRSLIKVDKLPVSFFDLLEDGEKSLNVCLGTRHGDEYRGRGYATKATEQAMAWVKMNKNNLPQDYIHWSALRTNTASRKLAEKYGFELYEDNERWTPDDEWVLYIYDIH